MNFEEALKKIEGAQSAGGQLIAHRLGKNILVGKHVQGMLIVENTDEARAVMAELTVVAAADPPLDSTGEPMPEPAPAPEPEPEPVTHEVTQHEKVGLVDRPPGSRRR